MQYRVAEPIKYNKTHIGVVQFGIQATFISDILEEKFHMLSGLAIINEECATATASKVPFFKGYTHTIRAHDTEVFTLLPKNIDWNKK